MKYRHILIAFLAAFGIGLAGCENDDTGDYEVDRELESVEQIDPEADVEVTPGGEVDVQTSPEVVE